MLAEAMAGLWHEAAKTADGAGEERVRLLHHFALLEFWAQTRRRGQ